MTKSFDIAVIAVDWGTSHLRMWPLDRDGNAMECHRSSDGMRTLKRDEFAAVFQANLEQMGVGEDVPVIMCGMVGSRQGWQEASYNRVPCQVSDVIDDAIAVNGIARDVRILPGIADYSADAPDVMRSEETQLLGLLEKTDDAFDGHICMPGSHAKWVEVNKGSVNEFATSLTGELFAALGASSVLKHAITGMSGKVDANALLFEKAVQGGLENPETFLTRLFSARPQSLLHDMNAQDAGTWISGTIIGQDIAGAVKRFGNLENIVLVTSGHLGDLYARALTIAGQSHQIWDGDELAIAGLTRAARVSWPDRFNTD